MSSPVARHISHDLLALRYGLPQWEWINTSGSRHPSRESHEVFHEELRIYRGPFSFTISAKPPKLIYSRDGHGYGLGYEAVNLDPYPENPNPNPWVYGSITGLGYEFAPCAWYLGATHRFLKLERSAEFAESPQHVTKHVLDNITNTNARPSKQN
ncbi:hypothetical protein B0H10DRAFT_1956050 [Mycena sp. CBHHK59/15]|nr:hypothetical protein B0H10DRAFT_1956050 [Mycena sp. CBHHK59/15]